MSGIDATQDEPAAEGSPVAEVPHEDAPAELGDPGKKALSAEREARKQAERELAAATARLKEIEDANLSDMERAQVEAQEAKAEAAKAHAELARFRVAAAHGITDQDDISLFLTGDDEETLTRQAQRLAERASAPTTPKPDRTQGASSSDQVLSTAQQFADQLGDF